jgi:hypothetical protein
MHVAQMIVSCSVFRICSVLTAISKRLRYRAKTMQLELRYVLLLAQRLVDFAPAKR